MQPSVHHYSPPGLRRSQRNASWHPHRRGFKEVPVHWVGHQSGKERFPRRDIGNNAPLSAPKLNQWRNNLTALSQHFNLYVVAFLEWIYVYQPRFPDQRLSKEPLVKWGLPVTKPGLRGHMPFIGHAHSEHSVNNMVISDLGDTEILVCACDDGDILVYYTQPFLKGQKPTPLFHCNVGVSAWGLAVHKEARLIAVSANSHTITVFAPALVLNNSAPSQHAGANEPAALPPKLVRRYSDWNLVRTRSDDKDKDGTDAGDEFYRGLEPAFVEYRHFNLKMRLKRHQANIPSISFCNTSEDPTGRYLASTDIDATTIIWDLHRGETVRVISSLIQFTPTLIEDRDQTRSGWGVLFLDRKSFTRTKSIIDAAGTCRSVSLWLHPPQSSPSVEIYDISQSQRMVQNATCRWDPGHNPLVSSQQLLPAPATPNPTPNDFDDISLFLYGSSDDEDDNDADDMISNDENPSDDGSVLSSGSAGVNGAPLPARRGDFQENKQGHIPEERLGPGITLDTVKNSKWTMFSHTVQKMSSDSALPRSPLLFLNPNKVHLFQSADMDWLNNKDGPAPSPIIMLDDPLGQSAPNAIRRALAGCDRMNLQVQIPDLGVVLLGSPKGRVAVLSLHLLEPDIEPYMGLHRTDVQEPTYTMRLDYILPFAQEEAADLRPLQPLVGLAAGPIPDDQSDNKKRYRIMLMYHNHTILSYEIGRTGSDSYADVKRFGAPKF